MSNLGYRVIYNYYCNDEQKYVSEESDNITKPTKCINNVNHSIKLDSLTKTNEHVNVKKIKQSILYDDCDMTGVSLLNVDAKLVLLAQRVRLLEEIIKSTGKIKFV